MSSDKPAVPGVLITETAYGLVSAFLYACRDHGNLRPHGCDHFPSDLIEALESCPPGLGRREPGELSGNPGELVERLRRRALRILDDARSEFINPDGPAAADEIERLNATIARLQSERAEDGEALKFYAGDSHPNPNEGPWGALSNDFGNLARARLQSRNEETATAPTQTDDQTATNGEGGA